MKFYRRQFALDIKSLDKTGSFAGYGSVFDNADYYNDVVRPGAFQGSLEEWQKKGKLPPVLWQHDSRSPIGPHTAMREDSKGLYTEGQLLIDDVQQARECYALIKSGTISGQSIGYEVPDGGMEYDEDAAVWNLTKIQLWECSIVTFPANSEAMIQEVKQIFAHGDLPTLRQFEGFLRDAGCSRKQAAAIAAGGLVRLLTTRDAGGNNSSDPEVPAALESTLAVIDQFNFTK